MHAFHKGGFSIYFGRMVVNLEGFCLLQSDERIHEPARSEYNVEVAQWNE